MQTAFDWDFDFDTWSALASSDPEAFEKQRQDIVNQAIAGAPAGQQQRLRGLQWRIDKVRERSGTPLAACIRISGMMWDAVLGDGGLVDSLQALRDANPLTATQDTVTAPKPRSSASVLPFPGAARDK
ncbi:MAG: DUF3135 domain-containing protein [Gammaproteobacteria bacterium]|nr:DUF3135 domain-containing protein [Gammaproteobacteria bacterium]